MSALALGSVRKHGKDMSFESSSAFSFHNKRKTQEGMPSQPQFLLTPAKYADPWTQAGSPPPD